MTRKLAVIAILFTCVILAGVYLWLRPRSPLEQSRASYTKADWQASAASARLVLESDKSNLDALRLLARASARQGRHDAAESIYRRLGGKTLEAEDLFLLGRGLLSKGQTEPALAALGAARDLNPNHAETLDAIGKHHLATNSLLEALEVSERLAGQEGWQARGLARLGALKLSLFDPEGASDALKHALSLDRDLKGADLSPSEATILLAKALLQQGKGNDAIPWLAKVAKTGPEVDWLMSRALLQSKNLSGAEVALKASGDFATSDPLRPDPAPYAGSAQCAKCHPKEYLAEQSSAHAMGLVRGKDLMDLPWPADPIVDTENAQVSQTVVRGESSIKVQTKVDGQLFEAVVEYALGSNHQGQTFVGREASGAVRELRLSRYPSAPLWDKTSEHPSIPPDAPGYLGRPVSEESLRKCLNCHATNFRSVQAPEGRAEALDHGIGCERCHGPGGNHLVAIELGFSDYAIAQPKRAEQGAATLPLCAQCHKAPGAARLEDPGFIRFQAPTFVLSKCYTESNGALSCVSCHNPHTNVSHDTKAYEAKCLSCHSSTEKSATISKICPVNAKNDCLNCHMPKVREAVPRAVFTDHQIRVRPR